MAKNRSKGRRQQARRRPIDTTAKPPVRPKAPAPAVKAENAAAELAEALPEAVAAAGGPEALDPAPEPPRDGVDAAALEATWREAATQLETFRQASQRLADRERELADEQERLRGRLAEVEEETARLAADRESVVRRTGELDEREQRLLERERDLIAREEREKETALGDARKLLEKARREVEAEQRALAEEHERTRAALRAELDAQRQELADQTAALAEERARLRALKVELAAQQEDVEEARELLDERVEHRVRAAMEAGELRRRELEQRYDALREHAEKLEEQIAARERIDRAFGRRTPEEVLQELQRLKDDNAELRMQRAVPSDTLDRLAALQEAELRWREERAVLVSRNEQLQRQLSAHEITALELERLKVTNEALAASADAYHRRVEELKRDYQELSERKEGDSPFPECYAMDARYGEERDDLLDALPPLDEFVRWLRHFLAQQYRMYYSETDLTMFLGGLSASRLHLLQGISGIGKTQLPLVFARAIQAESAIVPVSADWRTPQDLVGYFNAFERRYYESPFTQALYRAQCPANADRPFFVVMDEMNLSHPEQYFSEVLYQLGQPGSAGAHKQSLELMTTEVQPAPKGLLEGRKLPISPNVWFVGTANHDETTVSFADKTYDRSHVLELPARPEPVEAEPVEPPQGPYSLRAFRRAFGDARRRHAAAARDVHRFLDGDLRDRLLQDFRISSGSRLMAYLDSFVPVVCAAGGSEGDAADHVLATRILRKLGGRFEIPVRRIEELKADLPRLWKPFGTEPVRSLERLDAELHLRGGL
ncbi:hypothetical protein ABZ801_11235 [Actinomadura sp. NPDC047616]|uniref:hypothetical protein n=1 Tax=Actinomadura sp. NPDC047616 TaxID=3155914 RepID=UPI00340A3436